jgi:hypothetical protein
MFDKHAGGRYVWKLRGANTLFCDCILQAFPQTPWIFCVRDPLEVGVSDLADPPYWLRPFGDPLNPFLPYVTGGQHVTREVYVASAFRSFCQAISGADWARGKIIKYERLPEAVWSTVCPHFGLSIDELEREAMARRARMYSKAKGRREIPFSSDIAQKWGKASDELKAAVDRHARPALADLLSSLEGRRSAGE